MPAFDDEVFRRAAEFVHKRGGFTAGMLKEKPVRDVTQQTYRVLQKAISKDIIQNTPEELTAALENNAFLFSGFKTYHSLKEVGLSLVDDKGNIRPFDKFYDDVAKINERYNRNWLIAEYNHAVAASQMAVKWYDFEQDGDRYDLQYRTAGDDRVREEHAALAGVTLPPDDAFWDSFMPPNGWNCRCTVIQVRKGKYLRSDSEKAMRLGKDMTEEPKKRMFRFNPCKELRLFPDKHPYMKVSKTVEKTVYDLIPEIETPRDAVDFINESPERKGWFERGFKELKEATKQNINGSTDMNGRIVMRADRMNRVISALNKLQWGEEVDFDEADALATLWHEITHNRNKLGNMRVTALETRYMELANEFVSRKTLPEFYKSFGAEMQHPELMDNRLSTGYNTWVRNYDSLIKATGADAGKVLDSVKKHLFNDRYDNQLEGLVNAIKDNVTDERIEKNTLRRLVNYCLKKTEADYQKTLKDLLIK